MSVEIDGDHWEYEGWTSERGSGVTMPSDRANPRYAHDVITLIFDGRTELAVWAELLRSSRAVPGQTRSADARPDETG